MNYGTKNKLKNITSYILPIIAIFAICGFCAIVWFWETVGREKFMYDEVVVASKYILEGQPITKDNVKLEKFEASKVVKGAAKSVNEVINKTAKHNIPQNAQIHPDYVDVDEIIAKNDQYIFKLPNEWIKAVPSSLRRKDTAYIYLVSSNLFSLDSASKKPQYDKNGEIITTYTENYYSSQFETPIDPIKTVIAYVKDNANREVKTLSEQERLDASSNISEVNIIATLEEFDTIKEYVGKGYKIIIMYQE